MWLPGPEKLPPPEPDLPSWPGTALRGPPPHFWGLSSWPGWRPPRRAKAGSASSANAVEGPVGTFRRIEKGRPGVPGPVVRRDGRRPRS